MKIINLLGNAWKMVVVEDNTASCLQWIRVHQSQTQTMVRNTEILSPIVE